ncbi:transaldolase [Pseudovirgaria hyperparasitica]|uniref:Transaldolase n=1 Tax=Pseudovirgaria hyperparasitica TaxID=470096 RepID=A0A6A6W4Y0_9PEZI|nr:transaldolase [Pseudovirgaria hyperparasitica]KAF2756111.1 transaldolase [Pseudovirgaria hyperparasitica]
MKPQSLLDYLRERSQVSSDTLDAQIVESLGPFVDNTSNQAIAYGELAKAKHADLLRDAAATAQKFKDSSELQLTDVSIAELAIEIATIRLCLLIVPHVTNCVHVQVNPIHSYSTAQIIINAERIISLFSLIAPDFSPSRVCIKVPSTWEGLRACEVLEQQGINTLATTLFCMEQAVLAGKSGCTYIAPYVNELKVHFEVGYIDPSPNFQLCVEAQKFYAKEKMKTKVLAASLTSVKECAQLSGIDCITIAPALLDGLNGTDVEVLEKEGGEEYASYFNESGTKVDGNVDSFGMDYWSNITEEKQWRQSFKQRNDGRELIKLEEAISIFRNEQAKLEDLVAQYI